jgi:hypothetical protein
MVFFFLPAIVASPVTLASGAAVFHEIQNVVIGGAARPPANAGLYSEPDEHYCHEAEDCFGQIE